MIWRHRSFNSTQSSDRVSVLALDGLCPIYFAAFGLESSAQLIMISASRRLTTCILVLILTLILICILILILIRHSRFLNG